MTPFERAIAIVAGGLNSLENDPGFGYRVAFLPGEDQARIFRVPRRTLKLVKPLGEPEPPVPTKGIFVSAAVHPEKKQLVLAYGEFPKDGGESFYHGILAYDEREYRKGAPHIVDFLSKGKVPVADEEYAEG